MTPEEYREKMRKILGKHKVIGDTTYGLGYAEAEQLLDALTQLNVEAVKEAKPPYANYYDQPYTWQDVNSAVNTTVDQFESNLLALFKGGEGK